MSRKLFVVQAAGGGRCGHGLLVREDGGELVHGGRDRAWARGSVGTGGGRTVRDRPRRAVVPAIGPAADLDTRPRGHPAAPRGAAGRGWGDLGGYAADLPQRGATRD